MKTMLEAVQDTRRMVYGSLPEQINLLASDYVNDGDRLVFELDVSPIQQGMVLSAGLNEWWVKEVDSPSKTVYVVPRWNGSYGMPQPSGTVVMIRPRATDWQVFTEVNRAIMQMSSRTRGLYRAAVAICPASDSFSHWGEFIFNEDAMSVIRVRVREPWGGSGGWHTLQDRDYRWQPDRGVMRVVNRDYGWVREIEVVYRAPFTPAGSLIDDLEVVCGLSPSMTDIPALGAAASLLVTTEARRNQLQTQSDTRRQGEVPPGSNSSAARDMRRMFDSRCDDEAAALLNAFPIRQSI